MSPRFTQHPSCSRRQSRCGQLLLVCTSLIACLGCAATQDDLTDLDSEPGTLGNEQPEPGEELPQSGGQTGAENVLNPCIAVEEARPIADDEAMSAGFSAADVLRPLRDDLDGVFRFADGHQVPATLTVARRSSMVQYIDYEPDPALPDAGTPETKRRCDDFLHIPLVVRLSSADDASVPNPDRFDESYDLLLIANQPSSATASLPVQRFGAFRVEDLYLAPEQSVSLFLLLNVTPRELTLEISGAIQTDTGADAPSDTVSPAAAALNIGIYRTPLRTAR